jgi:glycosyltransferase involved in cell wall biosynthesis
LCYRVNLVRRDGRLCDGPAGGTACATHCPPSGRSLLMLERRQAATAAVLRGAAARVACSAFVAEAFAREHPDLPVRVVPHGIDLLRMVPRAPRADGGTVFGYIGTMLPGKGVDVLARAFAAAPGPSARLELVGPMAGEPAFREELEWIAGRDPRIRLRGPVPAAEIPSVLAGFDVLTLPTRLPETFSLALHEGFAAGLPALVSDLGHPAGVVRGAGCGLVLPDGDVAAWTAAIAGIVADPARLETWRARLPLPARVEEETFLYSQLYRACIP